MKDDGKDELDRMTLVQLKAVCKERGLKVSGKKADLKERIMEDLFCSDSKNNLVQEEDDFDTMTENDLRDSLVARGLSSEGNRDQLLERLRNDVYFAKGMIQASSHPNDRDGYIALSDALEAAANEDGSALKQIMEELKEKSQVEPKHMDITITSIGFQPIKYTAGGAPSVTADVLRTLAGDPFADPPNYGKVSTS